MIAEARHVAWHKSLCAWTCWWVRWPWAWPGTPPARWPWSVPHSPGSCSWSRTRSSLRRGIKPVNRPEGGHRYGGDGVLARRTGEGRVGDTVRPPSQGRAAPSRTSADTGAEAPAFMTTMAQSPGWMSQVRVCRPDPLACAVQNGCAPGAGGVSPPGTRVYRTSSPAPGEKIRCVTSSWATPLR
jgi:hypothetical protein